VVDSNTGDVEEIPDILIKGQKKQAKTKAQKNRQKRFLAKQQADKDMAKLGF
jgi:hypothetical protein